MGVIPEMLRLIVSSAFSPMEAQGAFIGGTAGYAFLWGMKRALFSNEAGQGSAPIAHAAAKTNEPVREAIVAGLGPFIDTIVVCTLTAMVILCSGVWNRQGDFKLASLPTVQQASPTKGTAKDAATTWKFSTSDLPEGAKVQAGDNLYTLIAAATNKHTGNTVHRLNGRVVGTVKVPGAGFVRVSALEKTLKEMIKVKAISKAKAETFKNDVRQGKVKSSLSIAWASISSKTKPSFTGVKSKRFLIGEVYHIYQGATLTAKAFDSVTPGLGKWLVTLAAWLFAISTMISWSYYGEQGVVYLFGEGMVFFYKISYCLLIVVASIPQLVSTEAQLDALTGFGTGIMLFANIPIMLIFGMKAMNAYHNYGKRLKAGEFKKKGEE